MHTPTCVHVSVKYTEAHKQTHALCAGMCNQLHSLDYYRLIIHSSYKV